MVRVAAYILKGNGLAMRTVPVMAHGVKVCGAAVQIFQASEFVHEHVEVFDVAIFWGYVDVCQAIMNGYRNAGKKAIYLDLAYWHRDTHYKVAVNDRHPTAYFQKVEHDSIRRKRFVGAIRPYRVRDCILVAGLSPKGAWAEKLEPAGSWESNAVAEIRKYTTRPIIYRPKPTWVGAPPIPDTMYSSSTVPIGVPLSQAMSVVTYHSNVGVDGLVEGAAVFSTKGVASVMGTSDLSKIEDPLYPGDREQWLNDVSYCQWSLEEMRDGVCWRHILDEGLLL